MWREQANMKAHTMTQIKPIETRYAGCRFRSRLEARWAVFFNALGLQWQYEPEGFETPAGRYLPDFKVALSKRDIWFEVKPAPRHQIPLPYEDRRGGMDVDIDPRWRYMAAGALGLYVTYGLPGMGRETSWVPSPSVANVVGPNGFCIDGFPPSHLETGLYRIWPNGEKDGFEFFSQCPHCGAINISYAGNIIDQAPTGGFEFLCCGAPLGNGMMYHGGVKKIMRAYDTARSARFEFGEEG